MWDTRFGKTQFVDFVLCDSDVLYTARIHKFIFLRTKIEQENAESAIMIFKK